MARKQEAFIILRPFSTTWKPYELYTEAGISLGGGYEESSKLRVIKKNLQYHFTHKRKCGVKNQSFAG